MEVTNDIKQRILEAITVNRENYPSDNKHAAALGISASVYNVLKKGKIDKQVSDTNWICLARRLDVSLENEIPWQVAEVANACIQPAHWSADVDVLADMVVKAAQPGDHILVMSNGGFGGIHQKLLDGLAKKAAAAE